MSLPIISVTSALPLTLSLSIRPFNILLAMLPVCFSHSWLNDSPNTAVAVEEGLPSWNLFTYQNGHLNGLRAKINAMRPLQESLLRSLESALHAQKLLVVQQELRTSTLNPFLLKLWSELQKRG